MTERFAIYYAPAPADPLAQLAARWLGRDPAGEQPVPATTVGISASERLRFTESARRYGFHATLKAPMRLGPGLTRSDLETELAHFAARAAPVTIGRLEIVDLHGFIALVAERQSAALTTFAFDVVAHFERFRAPLAAAERQRRIQQGSLNAGQVTMLDRYGYPYVGDAFQFHMTLSDRLADSERGRVLGAARVWLEPELTRSHVLDRLALFHEPEPGAPFERVADFPCAAEVTANA